MPEFVIRPVGRVESPLTERSMAPRQGDEGAPDCVVDGLRLRVRDLEALDGTRSWT